MGKARFEVSCGRLRSKAIRNYLYKLKSRVEYESPMAVVGIEEYRSFIAIDFIFTATHISDEAVILIDSEYNRLKLLETE